MIVPKRHTGKLEKLPARELSEAFELVKRSIVALKKVGKPHGYNIGITSARGRGRDPRPCSYPYRPALERRHEFHAGARGDENHLRGFEGHLVEAEASVLGMPRPGSFLPGTRDQSQYKKPMSKTVMFVFGTRPEAIKLAPIILKMKALNQVRTHVCVTAQHRQMLDQVLEVFGIRPDSDLDLMTPNQTLAGFCVAGGQHAQYLLRKVPARHGDRARGYDHGVRRRLCAFYHRIPFAHVEAGLRTENKFSPFPEEMNRRLATRLTDIHFAPTEWAKQNLISEGSPRRHPRHGQQRHRRAVDRKRESEERRRRFPGSRSIP